MRQGHDNHQLAKPDTSFISALRKSHPGCNVAVLTDQSTQIELPENVRLFRHKIDRSKLGRNAYANYYQYLAQVCIKTPCCLSWHTSSASAITYICWGGCASMQSQPLRVLS